MVFDITDLETLETTRFKPRNKCKSKGVLIHKGEEVANLTHLAMVRSPSLVGGKFSLEWHRMEEDISSELSIQITYTNPTSVRTWDIPDIQLLLEGSTLAIIKLDDILGSQTTFFAKECHDHIRLL